MTTFRYRSQFALVVTAMLILSGRSQDKPVTSIGAMPVAEILQRLGARQEDGLTDEQHHRYAQQFGGVDRNKDGRHSKEEYVENGRYMTLQARQGIFCLCLLHGSPKGGARAWCDHCLHHQGVFH